MSTGESGGRRSRSLGFGRVGSGVVKFLVDLLSGIGLDGRDSPLPLLGNLVV